jgi:hypothetical protein
MVPLLHILRMAASLQMGMVTLLHMSMEALLHMGMVL